VDVAAAVNDLAAAISAMDAAYSTDAKGFYNDRAGNERAKAMRDALNGLVFRLHKFITA
jgi:hypothetical protein